MTLDAGPTRGIAPQQQRTIDSEPLMVVNRWKRYGKDRLHVSRDDEVKIGWWDLLTDEGHPETPDDMPALKSAVDGWSNTAEVHPSPAAAPAPAPMTASVSTVRDITPGEQAPPRELTTPGRPWLDLAAIDAGAAAREQAMTARDAAPVRTFVARALGVHTDERAWRIGADGEEKVAAQLAKLIKKDPRWRVIHSIPVGTRGSDIDHLVIGPGGVFTVNTKHHPGAKIWVGGNTFLVDGHKQPYVRNSRHEAARASQLLTAGCDFPVHVEGVIVTVNADEIVVKTQPDG